MTQVPPGTPGTDGTGPAVAGPAGTGTGMAAAADLVRAAALAVPGVVGLHGGALGEVAVYLPGRRVVGVRLRPDRTEVHLVVAVGAPVRATAAAVQQAVSAARPGPVDVVVADVLDDRSGASVAGPAAARRAPTTAGPLG